MPIRRPFWGLVCLWGWSFGAAVCCAASSESSSDLIDRFIREYPLAASRLLTATDGVDVTGKYLQQYRSRSEETVTFSILSDHGSVRWDRRFSNGDRQIQLIPDNGKAFLLTAKPGSSLILHDSGMFPNQKSLDELNNFCWRFLKGAELLWDLRPLSQAIAQKDLVIDSAAHYGPVSKWIQFKVRYQHRDSTGQPIKGKIGTGTLILSPDDDWAIRGYEYDWPYVEPFRVRTTLEVRRQDNLGVVPTKFRFESFVGTKDSSNPLIRNEFYQFELVRIEPAKSTPADFAITQFAFVDPRQSSHLVLFANVAFILILCGLIVFRWFRSRHLTTMG